MLRMRLRGPVAKYTGYAVGYCGLARRLKEKKKIDFEFRSVRNTEPDYIDDDIKEMLNDRKCYTDVGVLMGFATYLNTLGTNYKILYSMYETDDIPDNWKHDVEVANEVWVPTTFCAKVFGKYNNKLRVVPWGIDERLFKKKRKPQKDFFHFGSAGVQSKRKGVDVLVAAFNYAFKGNPGVRLTIKTRDTKWLPPVGYDNIDVIDADWSEEQLRDFYYDLDCVVTPHRGEGISMVPLQAAMCGTPAITTNWSGPADYIDNNGIWGINIKGLTEARGMASKHAKWAEPDARHLVELMKWAVDTRPQVKGNYSKWTLDNMANEFTRCSELAWRRYQCR